jgi:hypothetical protein
MRKLALFAILGLFVAAFAFAQSEETTVIQQQPSSTSEKTVVTKDGEVIATIEKVDVPTKTFVVKTDKSGVTKTYTFNEKTMFGTKTNMLKVEDLKPGDVIILEANPENVVTKVRVKEITTETPPEK